MFIILWLYVTCSMLSTVSFFLSRHFRAARRFCSRRRLRLIESSLPSCRISVCTCVHTAQKRSSECDTTVTGNSTKTSVTAVNTAQEWENSIWQYRTERRWMPEVAIHGFEAAVCFFV